MGSGLVDAHSSARCCVAATLPFAERAPREPSTGGQVFNRETGEGAPSAQLVAGDSHCQHAKDSALSGSSVKANKDSHARVG